MSDEKIPSVAIVIKNTIHMGRYKFEACLLSNATVRATGGTEEEAISSLRFMLVRYHKSHGTKETRETKRPTKITMLDFSEQMVEEVMEE